MAYLLVKYSGAVQWSVAQRVAGRRWILEPKNQPNKAGHSANLIPRPSAFPTNARHNEVFITARFQASILSLCSTSTLVVVAHYMHAYLHGVAWLPSAPPRWCRRQARSIESRGSNHCANQQAPNGYELLVSIG
jgi:hypothetical protein